MHSNLDVRRVPTDTLQAIHQLIRKCLRCDDNAAEGRVIYGVREHPGWRRLVDTIERELVMRDAFVANIEWGEARQLESAFAGAESARN